MKDAEVEIISRIDTALSVRIDQAKTVAEPFASWLMEYFQYVLLGLSSNSDLNGARCAENGSSRSRIRLYGTFGIPGRRLSQLM